VESSLARVTRVRLPLWSYVYAVTIFGLGVLAGSVQLLGLSQTSWRLSRSSYWYFVTWPLASISVSRLPTPS